MKKRGFTLIELLAVIVVLAIIALIATPIVMNTIKKSQKGATERSADSYIRQVETAVAEARLDNKTVPDGTYQIDEEGNLTGTGLPDGKLKIEMNGNKPTGGTIKISNGQVTTDSKMTIGSYEVAYNPTTKKYEATEKGTSTKTYTNGEVVYFNVTTGTKCSSSDYTETQSNTGVKEGCMKFYAFNDEGEDTVNLILDHNTTATVAWNNTYTDDIGIKINAKGPKEVLDQLKTDTDTWIGTGTTANYTMDQTGQTSNAKYTIDYSGYKARLITANEVATITGNTTWDEKTASNLYYLDTNASTSNNTCKSGNTTGCKYGWLYDRTNTNCKTYGCLNNSDQTAYGYWTASSRADNSSNTWSVSFIGNVGSFSVDSDSNFGVRPVITISKSQLN